MKRAALALLFGVISLLSKDVWAPYECSSCGRPEKIRACVAAVHSEKFMIQGKTNPESAHRIMNALRNKLDDLSAALESINEYSTRDDFRSYTDARDDFDHLIKFVEKQEEAGEWSTDETTDGILDLCDDALHPDPTKKN